MSRIILSLLLISIGACATMPTGPSVMSLPGQGKSFDEFRVDDAVCRQYAFEQIGGVPGQQAAENAAVRSAVIGTALGALAGGAIGSASGDFGEGAAIGAGTGLLFGSVAGSGYASGSYYEAQRRYDYAYMQCMYAKGNQIPGHSSRSGNSATRSSVPPPPADYPAPSSKRY
jgi:hypothetical protein